MIEEDDIEEFYLGKLYRVKQNSFVDLTRFLSTDLVGRDAARERIVHKIPAHDVHFIENLARTSIRAPGTVLVTHKEVVSRGPQAAPGLFLEVLYGDQLYYVFNFHLLNLKRVKDE